MAESGSRSRYSVSTDGANASKGTSSLNVVVAVGMRHGGGEVDVVVR